MTLEEWVEKNRREFKLVRHEDKPDAAELLLAILLGFGFGFLVAYLIDIHWHIF